MIATIAAAVGNSQDTLVLNTMLTGAHADVEIQEAFRLNLTNGSRSVLSGTAILVHISDND